MTNPILGTTDTGNLPIDVSRLLETRLLVQSNSGGGKSWVLRRLLEQTAAHVQQIVVDVEGEFATLREKFDYVICAPHDADAIANPRTAALLARRLQETGVSAILDIYDLKAHERTTFVRLFLDSLINAPKSLWRPVMVVIDEAHLFCPQTGQAESMGSVIDLATRGRKRGLCAVLATQRLSKLHKDAAAELLNKLIGRTGLDVDVKRAADEIGLAPKQAMPILRDLKPGEFFAFGPALCQGVTKLEVGPVQTHHPKVGQRLLSAPPAPSGKIRKVLAELADLPKAAEQEARTLADLKSENANLKRELTLAKKQENRIPTTIKTIEKPVVGQKAIAGIQKAETEMRKTLSAMRSAQKTVDGFLVSVGQQIDRLAVELKKVTPALPSQVVARRAPGTEANPSVYTHIQTNGSDHVDLRKGARRILAELAARSPAGYSRSQVGALTRFASSGGTFTTYLSDLKRTGYVEERDGLVYATAIGIEAIGHDLPSAPTSHDEAMRQWRRALRSGAYRMLETVVAAGHPGITREQVAESVNMAVDGGTFTTYFSDLKRNGLITERGGVAVANDILFPS